MSYIVSAIKHGKRLHYRDLHHDSVVTGKLLNYFVASKGGNLPMAEVHPWMQLAFPDDLIFTPDALAAVSALMSRRFYPKWIKKALPLERMDMKQAAKGPPDPIAYYSPQFIAFAPKVVDDQWLYVPLAAFDISEGNKDPITLYDEQSRPVMDVIVPKDGMGYYLDENFVIERWHGGVVARG